MKIEWLGRIDYQAGLRIQEERLDDCLNDGEESVILLEHEPVYTIGRLPDKSSLRVVEPAPLSGLRNQPRRPSDLPRTRSIGGLPDS